MKKTALVIWSFLARNDWKESYGMDLSYMLLYERHPNWFIRMYYPFLFVWDIVTQIYGFIICGMIDHVYIDDSYGNTESGGDGWHCDRCGERHWNQYY